MGYSNPVFYLKFEMLPTPTIRAPIIFAPEIAIIADINGV